MLSTDQAPEPPNRSILRLDIDCARTFAASLGTELTEFCGRIEDTGPGAVAVLALSSPAGESADLWADGFWAGGTGVHAVNRWEQALRRLERVGALTIAVAAGVCGGPALDVLLTADRRIGTRDLRLLPPRLHTEPWPGMAVYRLAHRAGVARARELVLFGTEMGAERACEMGALDMVVAGPEAAEEAVTAMLAALGGLAGSELAIRRRLLLDAVTTGHEEALGTHLAACDRALRRARQEHVPASFPAAAPAPNGTGGS
ncbi:enoyl-CoA-hydratase DpgB [Actinomadura sp. 9N215]|uniref:enoyl-CoA-hydratase DpgB n=1 Tax=Actinomadura sp. 9N215 TaxID=3375150 RepID=UPI0037874C80